ncbi:hypothetical protein [Cupriavidus sp.]|uniref:hypothetical protein n=1 Tax=Cupriavidus sp. TaxID=1873897 RepID=UPI0025BE6A03|nr:hypothetical protein [Cupriavidus sp.]MCA3193605.1 hypothetical protein [Cupriavidus sp.]MCA3199995.1 hypothetical protein [Cupriavidus sp.]MCA3202008.1 hypothetical protein [Cupriavidus sp.]MCA3232218.1 hypothetical protein [Cupriavidus sp.]
MIQIAFAATTLAALLAAMAWGAQQTLRWMQRIAEGDFPMGIVSTATMIDRLVGLVDQRRLRMDEISFVRDLKEKVKHCRIVDLSADEVEKLDEIHGRLFR